MDAWSSFIIFLSEKKPLKKTSEDWVEWLTKLVTPYHHSFSLNSNTKDPSFLNNSRFRYSIRLFHEHFSLIIIFHECSPRFNNRKLSELLLTIRISRDTYVWKGWLIFSRRRNSLSTDENLEILQFSIISPSWKIPVKQSKVQQQAKQEGKIFPRKILVEPCQRCLLASGRSVSFHLFRQVDFRDRRKFNVPSSGSK